MAVYGSTVTFGGETLYVTNLTPSKSGTTVKQLIGKNLVEINILGRNTQDWTLQITGKVLGDTVSALGTNRADLETLDDGESHAYVDGIHDGNYVIMTGTLMFSDSGDDAGSHYNYSLTLKQIQ